MGKGSVHIPEGVAPFHHIIGTVPPGGVPVEPVHTNGVRIDYDIINKTHKVEFTCYIVIVCGHCHIITQNIGAKCVPLGLIAVFCPCTAPSFEEVNLVSVFVVIKFGKIGIVHFFSKLIHPPVVAIYIQHAGFVGSLI